MSKIYFLLFFLAVLISYDCSSATWEKVYVKKSADCFRNVKEVSSGGYILAGYTANFSPNDTDALAIRMNNNGDTLWTLVYNGPSSKREGFYNVLETPDGGFIFCGYTRSFSSSDNALILKTNSSGSVQWVKHWGGSGNELARDIVMLPDGKFVLCGYTTSAPAGYYDAFLLKIDQNGNTIWDELYGGTSYDDANSLKLLPDGGFLIGGQNNNQLYLVRTDSNGSTIWSKIFGTAGIDNIKWITFSQDGNGYILAGTTDGIGAGAEDGYLIKTDLNGDTVWTKIYGGNDNDGFHKIEQTSDGGYVGFGTSREGPWNNPNYWLVKFDANGNRMWEKFFGGNHHEHGYAGIPTSDGGYLIAGHSLSFSHINEEDAYAVKTNSSGNVSNDLVWTTITNLESPADGACGSSQTVIRVEVANFGSGEISSIPVTVEITGSINQTLTQTLSSSMDPEERKTLTFNTTVDLSAGGTFHFHCYTGNTQDVIPVLNYFDKTITLSPSPPQPNVTDGTHCGPGFVSLSASSPYTLKWFDSSTGGTSIHTGSSFTTPYITATENYYVQAEQNCPSARVQVTATITAGLTSPLIVDGERCGPGSVQLSASSAYPVKWYETATSPVVLFTGSTFNTPSINSNTDYFVAAENSTCSSSRVKVDADVLTPADEPNVNDGSHCGPGTINLSASSSDPMQWFTVSVGGTAVGSGSSFTTPLLNATTTYYVRSDNGDCMSNRVPVIATISTVPADPQITSGQRCGSGTVQLSATSPFTIEWYEDASGGNSLGTGNSFTTPSVNSTTTFYAMAVNGACESNRVPVDAVVNGKPDDPVTTPGEHCGPGVVNLSATASDPVTWFDAPSGGNVVGTGNSISPFITSSRTYYAETSNGICPSDRVQATATIFTLPVVNLGPDTILALSLPHVLDAGPGFNSYLWTPSGTAQTYSVFAAGDYCVTVTDDNGCTDVECIHVTLPVGIEEAEEISFEIYPQPSNGKITIEFSNSGTFKNQNSFISILDITGKKVFYQQILSSKESFDLTHLSKGIYIVRIGNDKSFVARKCVIN